MILSARGNNVHCHTSNLQSVEYAPHLLYLAWTILSTLQLESIPIKTAFSFVLYFLTAILDLRGMFCLAPSRLPIHLLEIDCDELCRSQLVLVFARARGTPDDSLSVAIRRCRAALVTLRRHAFRSLAHRVLSGNVPPYPWSWYLRLRYLTLLCRVLGGRGHTLRQGHSVMVMVVVQRSSTSCRACGIRTDHRQLDLRRRRSDRLLAIERYTHD